MSCMPPASPRLSLCMIVRDEERCLARCLESVRGVVDEAVVVDTGSRDASPDIARSLGALLRHLPWDGDFAAARNEALRHATGDWVLVLDADEELEATSREAVRRLITSAGVDGYQVRVRSLLPPGDLYRYEDSYLTRLFRRRPEYRYEQPIHEQVRPSIERAGGRVVETGQVTIIHHGYAWPLAQGGEPRAGRNLKLLRAAADRYPSDPYLRYQLGATYKALGDNRRAEAELRAALAMGAGLMGGEVAERLHQKLAQLALGREDYATALLHARQCLEHNPVNLVSLHVAGLACVFQGDVPGGYDYLSRLQAEGAGNLVDTGDLELVLAYCRDLLGEPNRP